MVDRISEFQDDEFVREAFAKGMDLREYARNIETELDEIERDHVFDYISQAKNFVELHSQIQSCDQILAKMEDMLSVFQLDLGNISTEIQTLQEQSIIMNIKLKNRTAVENQLSKVLEGIVIPPPMIEKITEGQVDEAWLAYLVELNKKMTYVKTNQGKNIKALKDVGPELEKLRLKATEKIREFLLTKIKSLRIPNTNVQILQQSVLLKYKELHQFVMERYAEVAFEIRQMYINSMKWYFYNHFERYNRGLQKLQNTIADKYDMLGYGESVKKGSSLFGTSRIALQDRANIFTLGDRINTLRNQDAGVILVHVEENKNKKYSYEALFRSFNLTLIDNASSEYLFIVEFFSKDNKPAVDIARDIFAEIFDSTVKLGLAATKQYVDNCFDAVGILLCIRLNTQFALELQRRRVPTLEAYTNQTNMLLWPRFQTIMNMHIDSVKKARGLVARDVHPHYVTRRYGEFAASILVLNEGYNDSNLLNSFSRLRNEVVSLLDKMSTEFDDRKNRYIFLINNYDLVITILNETGGKAVDPEIAYFKELLNSKIAEFVEEELQPYFGSLMSFVKRTQQIENVDEISAEMFEKVSGDFSAVWRQSITSINVSVIQNFSNFNNGKAVLYAVLGKLIIYYQQFYNLLEERMKDGKVRLRQQPVGVQTVMVEIKKFRSNF